MNENVKKLIEKFEVLETISDEDAADKLRDEMDFLWYKCTSEDLQELRNFLKEKKMSEFKSKFGFHPCDRETYLKLKAIKKAYWQCLYDFCRWNRWWSKSVNRQGDAPKYNELFILGKAWLRHSERRDKEGVLRDHYKLYPSTVTDHGFLALYELARTPNKEPGDVFDPATLKKIDEFYDRLCAKERVAA